jgi:hypothetical protein
MQRLPIHLSLSLLLMLGTLAPLVHAQVAPGQRVRVVSPAATGTFVVRSATPDTIVIGRGESNGTYSVPVNSITRLHVGEKRNRADAVIIGAAIGFVVGAYVGGARIGSGAGDRQPCGGNQVCLVREMAAVTGGAWGVGGALYGGLAGMISPAYRWSPVSLERAAFTPASAGFSASASFRF